jgi:hypothetical protein
MLEAVASDVLLQLAEEKRPNRTVQIGDAEGRHVLPPRQAVGEPPGRAPLHRTVDVVYVAADVRHTKAGFQLDLLIVGGLLVAGETEPCRLLRPGTAETVHGNAGSVPPAGQGGEGRLEAATERIGHAAHGAVGTRG